MHVRPLEYGVTGVRSYYVDERNILHPTAFDRNASERDPEVMWCEFDPVTPWRDGA